jgi:hypothetical protein
MLVRTSQMISIYWYAGRPQSELATSLEWTANTPRRPVTLYYYDNPGLGTSLATSDRGDRWLGKLARPFG